MRIAIAAAVACLSIVGVTATAQVHAAIRQHTEIPAEPLDLALRTLAKDRGFQVVYLTEDVRTLQTRGAVGDLTIDEALKKLLSDSRLEYKFVDENTVSIFPKPIPTSALDERNGASASARSEASSGSSSKDSSEKQFRLAQVDQGQTSGPASVGQQDTQDSKKKSDLEEIVVTGTNIHGATENSSPIRTIDRAAIDASGVTTVEDLFKSVPENVGGTDADTFRAGITGQAGTRNRGYASGVDLRGLGSDATLVLLNGHRLPIAADGLAVDIATIPLGIIDHVDILKDGASSVYGSDAVAGVVNFVTVNQFQGALTNVTGGTVTDGGKKDIKFDQMVGTSWGSGSIFGAYTFNSQGALSTADRVDTMSAWQPSDAIPPVVTNSIYLSGEQSIVTSLDAHLDVLASDRRFYGFDAGAINVGTPKQEIYNDFTHIDDSSLVTNLSLNWSLTHDWRVVLNGQYARTETKYDVATVPPVNPSVLDTYSGRNLGADLTADGPVLTLPGGSARLALGLSDRGERYGFGITELSRNVRAAYGELLLPFVGKENAISGVQRLELTVSDRYDDYSDFGGTNNPKVGVFFAPINSLAFRASYSTSFRAPLLAELARLRADGGDFLFNAPDADSVTGKSLQIVRTGENPDLQPETAHSITAGFDFHPETIKGLVISADYFSIDFKNRIESPSASPFLAANPALYGAFITRTPSLTAIDSIVNGPLFVNLFGPFSPGNIDAIVDDRLQNAESVKVDGIDFNGKLTQPLGIGSVNYTLDASYLLKYDDTLIAGEAPIDRLNTPYYPTKLRLRSSIGWSSHDWSSTLFCNYANSYINNTNPTDVEKVGSWLTFDGSVSYLLPTFTKAMSDTRVSFSVQNILDRQAPFVRNLAQAGGSDDAGFNYDPVNASLLGRYISIQLSTRWR